ncbi:MAG: hypothetical protein JSR98_04800 [Proteobacteria bacterium]|nr:hypothetical protein [Pseudomonadota bacterium]
MPDETPPEKHPDKHPAPPMDHSIGGRKESQYTMEMALHILRRAYRGESITSILADPATPSRRTLYDWIRDVPEFGDAWAEMRQFVAARQRARHDAKLAERAAAKTQNPRRRSGRRSTYDPERAQVVCVLIRQGWSNRQIGRMRGTPSLSTIHYWLRHQPAFRPLYDAACRQREFNLWLDLTLAVDEVMDGDPSGRAKAALIEKQMADHRPKVWRWD